MDINALSEEEKIVEEKFQELWDKAEEECYSTDGYHFINCPFCNRSGEKVK